MTNYEITMLISPECSDQNITIQKVMDFIIKEGGTVEKNTEPVRKKLSYPVKGATEAILANLYFYLDPEKIAILEKQLKSEGQIIRYLLSVRKISKRAPKEKIMFRKIRTTQIPEKTQDKTKVELKELDKKIEEILGE